MLGAHITDGHNEVKGPAGCERLKLCPFPLCSYCYKSERSMEEDVCEKTLKSQKYSTPNSLYSSEGCAQKARAYDMGNE